MLIDNSLITVTVTVDSWHLYAPRSQVLLDGPGSFHKLYYSSNTEDHIKTYRKKSNLQVFRRFWTK